MEILDKFFDKYSRYFEWVRPRAGTIAFPRLKVNVDVQALVEDLRAKKGVLLLPG